MVNNTVGASDYAKYFPYNLAPDQASLASSAPLTYSLQMYSAVSFLKYSRMSSKMQYIYGTAINDARSNPAGRRWW